MTLKTDMALTRQTSKTLKTYDLVQKEADLNQATVCAQ